MNVFSRKIFVLPLSFIFGGSLTALILFNFPLLFEQPKIEIVRDSILIWLAFSLVVGILYKPLYLIIFSIAKNKSWKDAYFIGALSIFIFIVIYSTSAYYWANPVIHQIKICYYSDQPQQSLDIIRITEAGNEHIYPPSLFKETAYPIVIQANSCIGGGLRSLSTWSGLSVINGINSSQTGSRLSVEVNQRVTTNILNYQHEISGEEATSVTLGADKGIPIISSAFLSAALIGLKWLSLILGSIYLALFLFTLTQWILFQDLDTPSYKIALAVVIIYFFIFGMMMTKLGGQPDQSAHNYFSTRFIETWGLPKDDPTNPNFTQDNVYLYYWINGAVSKIYNALLPIGATPIPNNQIWRFISVILSTATIFYFYKIAREITNNPWGGILAAFFGANTLMFVFVSSGVSYDNFMSLSAAASLYHLVKIIKKADYIKHTALLGIWLCTGALAKNQILLLAFILFFIWLFISIKDKLFLRLTFSRRHIAPLVLLILFIGLFSELYIGNLIKYKKPLPSCQQVKLDDAVCTKFSERSQYRQEVDYKILWQDRNSIIGPVEYALDYWLFNVPINGIWGIISHRTFVPKAVTSLHHLLVFWATICLTRYWKKEDATVNVLILVAITYAAYVFSINYKNELTYDFRHYAVQGRYLFPVFGAFLTLMTYAFLQLRNLLMKRASLALSIMLYFGGGLGMFIFHYYDVFSRWIQ